MTSLTTSLSKALPKPKYTGDGEALSSRAISKGPRVLGGGSLEEAQLVVKVCIPRFVADQVLVGLMHPRKLALRRMVNGQAGDRDR